MNGFTQFITAVSASFVFIGAVGLICPDGAMQKPIKYILSLAFLLTVISSVGFLKSFELPKTEAFTSVNVTEEELFKSNVEYVYKTVLTNEGINFREITVCTDKSETGSIVISKLIIYSDSDRQRILNALRLAEDIEVEIINE